MSKPKKKLESDSSKKMEEAYAKMKESAAMFKNNLYHFSMFFMADYEDQGIQVPTRMNRIVNGSPSFQMKLFGLLDNIRTHRRLALASPRGFLKSTTCSIFFPLQAALYKNFNSILIISNSEALSIQLMRQIRINIESNYLIRGIFGDMASDKWTETELILKNGVSIRGCGWGAQIRGFRPDLIIMDDIESDETVASEDMRKKMRDWINTAAINALSTDGCLLFIGTIISRLSILYDYIHHPPMGWKSIFNQAYEDGVQEPGHELWPEEKPHTWLQQRKSEIGSWAFSSEFMNDPMPQEGNRFNPSTFRYFEDRDIENKNLGEYIAIDPAFSESSTSDFGVILSLLHDSKDNAYVYDVFRRHATSGDIIRHLKLIYKSRRERIRAVGIECNGPQRAFYDRLVEECNLEGLYPPFVELKGMIKGIRNKIDRITFTVQPRLEAGKLHFRKDQTELIEELTLFPESKHDDQADALAYAIDLLQPFNDYGEKPFSFENDLEPDYQNRGTTGYGLDYAEREYAS